jgi:hypothetical protein
VLLAADAMAVNSVPEAASIGGFCCICGLEAAELVVLFNKERGRGGGCQLWNAVWNGWTAGMRFLTGWTGQIRGRGPVPVAGPRGPTARDDLTGWWMQVKNRRARLVWKICKGRGRLCTGGDSASTTYDLISLATTYL